ncbi:hypothetical protein G9F31_03480 [Acinetobacter sp. 187]|uniref:hypothetical protein n=1 Tax=Acinetobacter lanii TaxID=2715163 RepID=UPI00140B6DCE|nr:hypothetical protein [Acinetobacter lanii]NHC02834.1 hypothetical protein [Acinetobacter lanii]
MKMTAKQVSLSLLVLASTVTMAKPMPNSIVVDDKAVVPVVKTQVIRRVEGQAPVRTVEATVFEVTNQGKDIVARELVSQDNEATFSDKGLSVPVLKQGGVIVPTSKIEVTQTLKQDEQVLSQKKVIDAAGVEIKKDGAVVKRQLLLDQQSHPEANEKMSHAVVSENGTVTKDIVVFDEAQPAE